MKKEWKFLRWTVGILIACLLNAGIWIASHGVPLMGLPDAGDVVSVSLVSRDGGTERVVTDEDGIQLLTKAANLCNYRPFSEATGEPELSVTYHLKDGREILLEASRNSMWWHGGSHGLKEPDSFVNIVEGLFFSEPEQAE